MPVFTQITHTAGTGQMLWVNLAHIPMIFPMMIERASFSELCFDSGAPIVVEESIEHLNQVAGGIFTKLTLAQPTEDRRFVFVNLGQPPLMWETQGADGVVFTELRLNSGEQIAVTESPDYINGVTRSGST